MVTEAVLFRSPWRETGSHWIEELGFGLVEVYPRWPPAMLSYGKGRGAQSWGLHLDKSPQIAVGLRQGYSTSVLDLLLLSRFNY